MCHVPGCTAVRDAPSRDATVPLHAARAQNTQTQHLRSACRLAEAPRDAARGVARCPLLPNGGLPERAPLGMSWRGLRRAGCAAAGLLARRRARGSGRPCSHRCRQRQAALVERAPGRAHGRGAQAHLAVVEHQRLPRRDRAHRQVESHLAPPPAHQPTQLPPVTRPASACGAGWRALLAHGSRRRGRAWRPSDWAAAAAAASSGSGRQNALRASGAAAAAGSTAHAAAASR